MKGAFRQEKDKTWTIDTKVKVDGVFKHFQKKGYSTLSSAKADFETQKELFIKKHSVHHKTVLFEDLLDKYKEMRRFTVDVSTLGCDQSIYNVYFLPYFKGKLIKDCLTREEISQWYKAIIDSPKYSNNKKSKIITRMKDLLKFSYMHEYIDAPTYQSCDVNLYQVKYKKTAEVERVIWTPEEERDFILATKENHIDYIMFKLFLTTSPRIGEFLGLQANCFDHRKRKITIKQQVKNISGKGAVLTDKLKTHDSYRTIILTEELANLLEEYIRDFDIKPNEFLFYAYDKASPLSRNSFRRKLYKYCDMARVRRINPHASRHIQATKLASVCHTGTEIEAAARRLGHSPDMFMNTYARHTNDKVENQLLERLWDA